MAELMAWRPVCSCEVCTARSQRKWLAANEARKNRQLQNGQNGGQPRRKSRRAVLRQPSQNNPALEPEVDEDGDWCV